jgi:methyl-accepting chemotaxis protein
VGRRALSFAAAGGGALAVVLGMAVQAADAGLLATVALVALAGGLAGSVVHRVMSRQRAIQREVQAALEQLVHGENPPRLLPLRLGPLAETGDAVNRVGEILAGARTSVRELSQHLATLPDRIQEALDSAQRGADEQEAAVEETAALQANINNSIRSINEEVESLARANEESASSILQLGSAVEQVARAASTLHETVESSTSSLHQVGESIRTVAQSTDSVQEVAEETAASITEMDRTIQEVGIHVRGAAQLTDRVSQSADEGSRAVGATIDGIAEIREVTLGAKGALEGLAQRIGEIGEIATVIRAITDETNLLSLNAAIIAAQAGEHGKAFAVVADQVKTLALRTSQSTNEIGQLIGSIQDQSQRAVEAMAEGIDSVEQGVRRSRVAGEALEVIRISARDASGRVGEIARAAEEQARNSKQVAEAARRTSEHVQQISSAMAEQSQASERLLDNSNAAVEMCRQMTSATEEQRASGSYITANIEAITERIRSIQASTRAHERASASVAETFYAILDTARQSAGRLPGLGSAIAELHRQASAMDAQLSRLGSAEGPAAQEDAEA